MENKSHALAAGAFVLVMAALLAAMATWLTRDHSEQRLYEISSHEGVTGLQPQAGVRYKGVLVGRVTSIELDRTTRGNVLVRLALNESVPMTTTTFATLGFQGVTGLAFVQLDDTVKDSPELLTSKEQIARIPMRAGMVSRFTEQGGNLLGQLEQASQKANALLAAENQKVLMQAVGQLGQAASNIARLTQHVDAMLTPVAGAEAPNLPRLALQADSALRSMQATAERLGNSAEAVRSSANEFKRMSTRMNEPGGTLDRIAQGTEVLAITGQNLNASLLPRLNRTADDTARTVRQVGKAAQTVTDTPQSLLLGKGAQVPGPGEPGFVAPAQR